MRDGLEPGLDPDLADITDDELFDTLESQYQRGEPLNPEFVWEAHKRTIVRTRTAELRRELESAEAERDRLRTALDVILDGLVGLDSDNAFVAITMDQLNVVRATLKEEGA